MTSRSGRAPTGDPDSETNEPGVAFIVAWERSGSTLLTQLLGEMDDTFGMGEVHHLLRPASAPRVICGCGRNATECEIWSRVISHMSCHDEVAATRRADYTTTLQRLHRIIRERPDDEIEKYIAATRYLYLKTAEISETSRLIDSSKAPSIAAISLRTGLDVRVVHLVRDVRATVYSGSRPKFAHIRRPPIYVAQRWTAWNLAAEWIRSNYPEQYLVVRYEDLAGSPRPSLHRIAEFIGGSFTTPVVNDDGAASLRPGHQVGGNTVRFQSGTVHIAEDDEWKLALPQPAGIMATAIGAPLLRRYGYPILSSRRKSLRSDPPALR